MSKATEGQTEDVVSKEVGHNGLRTDSSSDSQEYNGELLQKRSVSQRTCGILRKFWWAFLIVFCIGVLVVTLPLILVGFPRIVQDKMDGATVSVQGIRITQPTIDSVWLEMNSTIHSSGGISATIDPFNATLYLEDDPNHTPFAYVQMPQTSAEKTVLVNISQHLSIYNMSAYTEFNTKYLLSDSFRVTFDGNPYVHVKGLKATQVNFHKTVTLTGLNGFSGLNVTQFDISLTADSLGDNFNGYATIPNPTLLTVEIGNTTFSNLLNGTSVGTLFIDNLTLYPGNNNVSIRANITQAPIILAITSQEYCHSGVLPLDVVGEYVVDNGVHLPYYETGFQENKQTVYLNVSAALAKTLGKPLGCAT